MEEKGTYAFENAKTAAGDGEGRAGPGEQRAAGAGIHLFDETELDNLRYLLIELAHMFGSYLVDKQLLEGVRKGQDSFMLLGDIFRRLADVQRAEPKVAIRHRGFTSSVSRSGALDYEIMYNEIMVDGAITRAMTKRMGVRMSHLEKRLLKAFEVFSNHSIHTLDLRVPTAGSEEEMDRMRLCLSILSRYNQAYRMNTPIGFKRNGVEEEQPIIQNQRHQADINLTMLAALNRMDPDAMADMVSKVAARLQSMGMENQNNVYAAIFAVKSYREKLIRPPLEVNNVRPAGADGGGFGGGGGGGGTGDGELPEGELMEGNFSQFGVDPADPIARTISEVFADSPRQAAAIMRGIYANDYKRIDTQQLANRIHMIGKLLDSLDQMPEGDQMFKEILQHVEGRIEQVRESVLGNMAIQEGTLKVRVDGKEAAIGKVNPKLLKAVAASKARATIKKKMRNIMRGRTTFSAGDFRALSADFQIPEADAREIVGLLKNCFSEEGHFLRKNFEANIPKFARHERKIFEFVWHYLKETLRRQDRVAFLNSLQHLIAAMKQRQKGIGILMTDFLRNPTAVDYSDRNAVMLSNLLIRKYNKELNLDIELTPEEVLLVRDGVDTTLARAVAQVINNTQDRLMRKLTTIRRQVRGVLGGLTSEVPSMPLRYLLSLEREVYIFLALLDCKTSHVVLQRALNVYGDPASEIYRLRESRKNLQTLTQHLKVILRCMGRVGRETDLSLLDRVGRNEAAFLRLANDPPDQDKVRQVLRWAERSREEILRRTMKDSRDSGAFTLS